jgi:hypothetical protein
VIIPVLDTYLSEMEVMFPGANFILVRSRLPARMPKQKA